MNIGIYGGTFDPPHRGHIAAAKAAMSALHLDRLLLIPDAVPPHKALPEGSPTAQQRCDMAVLATAELGRLAEASDMELRRAGGRSALRRWRISRPSAGSGRTTPPPLPPRRSGWSGTTARP